MEERQVLLKCLQALLAEQARHVACEHNSSAAPRSAYSQVLRNFVSSLLSETGPDGRQLLVARLIELIKVRNNAAVQDAVHGAHHAITASRHRHRSSSWHQRKEYQQYWQGQEQLKLKQEIGVRDLMREGIDGVSLMGR